MMVHTVRSQEAYYVKLNTLPPFMTQMQNSQAPDRRGGAMGAHAGRTRARAVHSKRLNQYVIRFIGH